MKQRVLITPPYSRPGDEMDLRLRDAGFETVHNPWTVDRSEIDMIGLVKGVDAVIAFGDPFTARVFAAADRLKIIARPGAGYERIDVRAATEKRVVVTTSAGNRRAVAEFAFALMVILARRMIENLSEVPQGRWTKHAGVDLGDKTLGVVGFGAIGKSLATRARAFEMRVLAYDVQTDETFAEQHQISYVGIEQLLRESDFVSLHVPSLPATHHLMDAERLALMKPTAYLINTARGEVVDPEALYMALKDGRIAGAALDVFEQQPLPADSPLRELSNVLLSPHVAGYSSDAQRLGGLGAAENVIRHLNGLAPISPVNPEVLAE